MKEPKIKLHSDEWNHLIATQKCNVLAGHVSYLRQLIEHQDVKFKELERQLKLLKGG